MGTYFDHLPIELIGKIFKNIKIIENFDIFKYFYDFVELVDYSRIKYEDPKYYYINKEIIIVPKKFKYYITPDYSVQYVNNIQQCRIDYKYPNNIKMVKSFTIFNYSVNDELLFITKEYYDKFGGVVSKEKII